MNTSNEAGFTLLELLVAIVIVGLLFASGISAFEQYRDKSYYSISQHTLQDARTALEAGKINQDEFGNSMLLVFTNTPGLVTAGDGTQLVPGLTLPNDTRLLVQHNPSCTSATLCLEDIIVARHCKSSQYLLYAKLSNGAEIINQHIDGSWGC